MSLKQAFLICSTLAGVLAHNSSYVNPILPGFHPDPSCIFVPEEDNTFFCASSSFLTFPGVPVHASRDLKEFKLISNALSRPEQLPDLANARIPSGGIWAPTLRYHRGVFYLFTTLVFDERQANDSSRWDNFFVTSKNPYDSSSWSKPTHFKFTGYDPDIFWDEKDQAYLTGAHAWLLRPGIDQAPINLKTGRLGKVVNIWNGTGALAPEGPHVYKKDSYYYLLIAEGGTGRSHQASMARSKHITGPYESYLTNPVLTNANTTSYIQAVGHADLFHDKDGQWWACALGIRVAEDNANPMARETFLTPVTWRKGAWPVFSKVAGNMSGWHMASARQISRGEGSLVDANHYLDFAPRSIVPPELLYFRIPILTNYLVSPKEHPYSLRLQSSITNLSGSNDVSGKLLAPTFISQRQTHTYFIYSANLYFNPQEEQQEAGVTAFLDQNNHYDLGIVLLCNSSSKSLIPYFRLRGVSDLVPFPSPALIPVPTSWLKHTLKFQIQAHNHTHYSFSVGLASANAQMQTIGYGAAVGLSWKFTGTLLGSYATTNGQDKTFPAYVSKWSYVGLGQRIE